MLTLYVCDIARDNCDVIQKLRYHIKCCDVERGKYMEFGNNGGLSRCTGDRKPLITINKKKLKINYLNKL